MSSNTSAKNPKQRKPIKLSDAQVEQMIRNFDFLIDAQHQEKMASLLIDGVKKEDQWDELRQHLEEIINSGKSEKKQDREIGRLMTQIAFQIDEVTDFMDSQHEDEEESLFKTGKERMDSMHIDDVAKEMVAQVKWGMESLPNMIAAHNLIKLYPEKEEYIRELLDCDSIIEKDGEEENPHADLMKEAMKLIGVIADGWKQDLMTAEELDAKMEKEFGSMDDEEAA